MFRFANIEVLGLLASIPVIAIGYWLYTRHKRRQLEEFGDPELMAQLMPNASHARPTAKFCIVMVALTLLIIAAAREVLYSDGSVDAAYHRRRSSAVRSE